ncbi:hypothetical protein Y032_0252g218 [Ancylostoma ceylanicum]|uniref:7TM GPCR serpentine receptor class x (Srx) domain-containing protein n=1 Tax=Ancylostoma ceylanicum TaxID=53326 RepID=A0A016SCM5_9BILA|nr:hypothetical protein Y032_0252g218 [Ancylostoma ceylanicum]
MRAIPSRSIFRSNKVEAGRRTLCLITFSSIVLIAHSSTKIQILYFQQLIARNWQRVKYVAATVCCMLPSRLRHKRAASGSPTASAAPSFLI